MSKNVQAPFRLDYYNNLRIPHHTQTELHKARQHLNRTIRAMTDQTQRHTEEYHQYDPEYYDIEHRLTDLRSHQYDVDTANTRVRHLEKIRAAGNNVPRTLDAIRTLHDFDQKHEHGPYRPRLP